MIRRAIVALAILAAAPAQAEARHSYFPPEGVVPDEQTAVKIAEAILTPIYGRWIEQEKPFHGVLKNGVWTVTGTLCPHEPPGSCIGGVAEIDISKRDSRVLRITHGQ